MSLRVDDLVFNNSWRIIRIIGAGANGIVYEIQKEDEKIQTRSALKVITIPPDPSMIGQLLSEGLTEEEADRYVQDIVDSLIDEIRIMLSLKDFPYIVRCEDFDVIKDERNHEWTILIRMELLTSLRDYLLDNIVTEETVQKIGTDITKALILFEDESVKILHRDIKPENLFVNAYGFFKVGDFGVARVYNSVSSSRSRKGTYEYMAPEVFKHGKYGPTIDIYSLGLILYQMLNNNRLPFFPLEGSYSYEDRDQFLIERLSGRSEIPAPVNASKEFAAIILKMIAYNSGDRYQNATDLLHDLSTIKPSQKQVPSSRVKNNFNEQENVPKFTPTAAVFPGNKRWNSRDKKSWEKSEESDSSSFSEDKDRQSAPAHNQDQSQEESARDRTPSSSKVKTTEGEKDPVSNPEPNVNVNIKPGEHEVPAHRGSSSPCSPGNDAQRKGDAQKDRSRSAIRKTIIIGASAVVIILAILVPFLQNQKYELKVNGGTGTGEYKAGALIEVHAKSSDDKIFDSWISSGIQLSDSQINTPDISIKMPRHNAMLDATYSDVPEKEVAIDPDTLFYIGKQAHENADYAKAIENYTQAAEGGSLDAIIALANMYYSGEGVERDYAKALTYSRQAAELGDTGSYTMLGEMYENGNGVEQDYEKALEYYKKAADLGDLEAMLSVADMYYSGKQVPQDYEMAAAYYEKAAGENSVAALIKLAQMHEKGLDVSHNYTMAADYYEKAANLGDVQAMMAVAKMYYDGIYVDQDYSRAATYYEMAAADDNPSAMNNIGAMYYLGQGVEQSYAKAAEYYKQAAALDSSSAAYNLAGMYEKGYGVDQNYEQAKEYYELAIRLGDIDAIYSLGLLYYGGVISDGSDNFAKAAEYFKRAAEQGNEKAEEILAKMKERGLI